MIAESSSYNPWDGDVADRMSLEQTGKHLIRIALGKLRNILGPMGILKGGEYAIKEPSGPKEVQIAFNNLRRIVKEKATEHAKMIASGEDASELESFWGIRIPTSWFDVEVGQYGKPTTTGLYDDILRGGIAMVQTEPRRVTEVLNQMGIEISNWY
jgi:hypothetical protein